MTLGDLYGTWNVNTEKNVGHDSNRLSGCKNNSHTHGLRSKITDHRKLMGNGEKNQKYRIFLCVQSANPPQCRKKIAQK